MRYTHSYVGKHSTRDIKKIRTKHTTASSVGANLDEQLTSGLLCDSVQSVCVREKVKQRIPIMRVTTERDGSGLKSGTYKSVPTSSFSWWIFCSHLSLRVSSDCTVLWGGASINTHFFVQCGANVCVYAEWKVAVYGHFVYNNNR